MTRQRPDIVLCHWAGLDFFDAHDLDRIDALGHLLDREPIAAWDDPRADDLLAAADVLLGHWGCPAIDGALLERAPRVGLIAYAAGTVKQTVAEDVWIRDIRVTSGAPANAEPVAEFTLAAILFANKNVTWRRDRLRAGDPTPLLVPGSRPVGNYAKTIGIIGASLVGRRVIELLASFPHLRVLLYDPFVDDDEAAELGVELAGLDALCARADVVSIHAPDLPSTRLMVGAAQLAAMRDGATLINTARGRLLDHDALVAELESGRLYAFLDVTDPEPLPDFHPLRSLPNVFLTPHLAGSEGTELGRMTDHVIDEIRRWSAGERARNEVTKDQLPHLA